MDIKDLNKSQLVLLTILVTFVISIGTSIATVALLQVAPIEIVQPINRIIRETVEKVVQVDRKVVQTVIIKQEDLLVDAIQNNLANFVDLSDGTLKAKGILISPDGIILTGIHNFDETALVAATDEKTSYKVKILAVDDRGFSLFKILPEKEGQKLPKFSFSNLADSGQIKVGQTAVVLGKSPLKIVQSFVAGFGQKTIDKAVTPPSDGSPQGGTSTDVTHSTSSGQAGSGQDAISPSENESFNIINLGASLEKIYSGNAVIDLDGNIIGVARVLESESYVLPANLIKETIANLKP